MRRVYNKLTPGQAERLALLSEEMDEAIQAIGKILRHLAAMVVRPSPKSPEGT